MIETTKEERPTITTMDDIDRSTRNESASYDNTTTGAYPLTSSNRTIMKTTIPSTSRPVMVKSSTSPGMLSTESSDDKDKMVGPYNTTSSPDNSTFRGTSDFKLQTTSQPKPQQGQPSDRSKQLPVTTSTKTTSRTTQNTSLPKERKVARTKTATTISPQKEPRKPATLPSPKPSMDDDVPAPKDEVPVPKTSFTLADGKRKPKISNRTNAINETSAMHDNIVWSNSSRSSNETLAETSESKWSNATLRRKASIIVGVIFVPSLIIMYTICSYLPDYIIAFVVKTTVHQ